MNIELSGEVKIIKDAQTFGSGFTKREFVIEVDKESKYPQLIPIEVVQDKISLLDPVKVGDVVSLNLNLRGSEWNDRHFLSLQAWKLEVVGASGGASESPANDDVPAEEDEDDLPF